MCDFRSFHVLVSSSVNIRVLHWKWYPSFYVYPFLLKWVGSFRLFYANTTFLPFVHRKWELPYIFRGYPLILKLNMPRADVIILFVLFDYWGHYFPLLVFLALLEILLCPQGSSSKMLNFCFLTPIPKCLQHLLLSRFHDLGQGFWPYLWDLGYWLPLSYQKPRIWQESVFDSLSSASSGSKKKSFYLDLLGVLHWSQGNRFEHLLINWLCPQWCSAIVLRENVTWNNLDSLTIKNHQLS